MAHEELVELNAEMMPRLKCTLYLVASFICYILSVVRYKVLFPTDFCNKVIQARKAILDVELPPISKLLDQLLEMLSECEVL